MSTTYACYVWKGYMTDGTHGLCEYACYVWKGYVTAHTTKGTHA